jgi:hypothetical protein
MDLDKQIQVLIDDAPEDGVTPQVVEAIAPGLKLLGARLHHREYYILQSLAQDWVVTTLSDRTNPKITKNVIYAFSTLKDASAVSVTEIDPQVLAVPIPVTHILFQLFALETVDSIIFFETPGDLNTGVEIRRTDLQNLIQVQLQQKSSQPSIFPSQIPPDIA